MIWLLEVYIYNPSAGIRHTICLYEFRVSDCYSSLIRNRQLFITKLPWDVCTSQTMTIPYFLPIVLNLVRERMNIMLNTGY